MGKDGITGSMVAKDVFAFALHYYGNRDCAPVSSVTPFASVGSLSALFNGNIAAISQHLPSLGTPLLYSYNYDVLNRLKKMQASNGLNTTNNTWTPVTLPDFKESISYDANGNILSYNRKGNNTFAGKPLAMDSLSYTYQTGTNKLDFIDDRIDAANYDNDIDNQVVANYTYDAIGNLKTDNASGLTNITWNVYGKIASITKSNGPAITYTYDVAGNRVSKNVGGIETWYVRDASGNVMSIYTNGNLNINNGATTQTETDLYGSSRLGINTLNTDVSVDPVIVNLPGLGAGFNTNFIRGKKFFELSNHLGNVLATVSDRKLSIYTGSTFDHYEADIVSSQEYYPFGMQMPGRGFSSSRYRYGFNGQEKSDEIAGEGNHTTAEFWEYDPKIGRRWNIDPKPKIGESSYLAFSGNPIFWADPLGDAVIVNSSGAIISNKNIGTAVYVHHFTDDTNKFIGNLGGTIDGNEIMSNLMDKNVAETRNFMKIPIAGPIKFYNRVKNRSEWDYKSNSSYIYDLANRFDRGNNSPTWFKFDEYLLTASDFGNFHYGVVGLATNFFQSRPYWNWQERRK